MTVATISARTSLTAMLQAGDDPESPRTASSLDPAVKYMKAAMPVSRTMNNPRDERDEFSHIDDFMRVPSGPSGNRSYISARIAAPDASVARKPHSPASAAHAGPTNIAFRAPHPLTVLRHPPASAPMTFSGLLSTRRMGNTDISPHPWEPQPPPA